MLLLNCSERLSNLVWQGRCTPTSDWLQKRTQKLWLDPKSTRLHGAKWLRWMRRDHQTYSTGHYSNKKQHGILCGCKRSETRYLRYLVVSLVPSIWEDLTRILNVYSGPKGALKNVHEFPGACHKHFRTKEQAEAFIEDWKETFLEVLHRALKNALDEGLRPQDLKLDTQRILCGAYQDPAIEDISQRFDSVMSLT